jgi:hypothetical protein
MIRNDPCPYVYTPALAALREALVLLQRVAKRHAKID